MTYRFRSATGSLRLDPGHLPIRDRAVLRILNRCRLATAAQLAVLVYHNRHYAQIRLRRLWDLGYLERAQLPPVHGATGGPYAYRLASACITRLGYGQRPWRGPGYVAHTLDAVEAVCALVRSSDPETAPLVLRWLPESIVADILPQGPAADTVLVLGTRAGAVVLCLEIDEANQHVGPIRDKLRAYGRVLDGRAGWHVLFVVPTAARAAWIRRAGAGTGIAAGHAWVTTLDELRERGPAARVASVPAAPPYGQTTLASLTAGPGRTSSTPVGSRHWLEILGSGGSEAP